MILEGIVTTLDSRGEINIAPMGPIVDDNMSHLVLRPFSTSRTYQNLRGHGEGVFHVTDDVVLLARAVTGAVDPLPELNAAHVVRGKIIAGACRFYEFRVTSIDDTDERVRMNLDVVHMGRLRDFFGFNRAKHAVVEAAILATRAALLPRVKIDGDYERLAVIIDKTGGEAENQAFRILCEYVARQFAVSRQLA